MQDNQSPHHPLLSLQQWLAVLLTLVIILLTIVLSILMVVQFENSLATNLVTIFGLVGTAIGILSLPFFKGSLQLLGAFMHTIRVASGSLMRGLAEGFTRLIKHLPRRWNYALLVLSLGINIFSLSHFLNKSDVLHCQDGNNILQIVKEANGEDIGISNSQGCKVFTSSSISNAYQAETDIYTHNPSITTPHMTLIVTTMLSGTDTSSISSGTALLQGVDIAQQEYNNHLRKDRAQSLPLRLLIANTGSNEEHAVEIAQQITQLAQHDPSIIGVMGWPFSKDNVLEALRILNDAGIPSVSSSLSSDSFTAISPYFFRVVPPNKQQAEAAASFLEEKKRVKHVILCVDYHNDYSNSLANNFLTAFNKSGNTITKESYTRGDLSRAKDPLGANANALGKRIEKDLLRVPSEPEAVYFAGYANDLDLLRGYLSKRDPNIIVMGGDGLDEYGADNPSTYSNYKDIYFTTFSSYQIWDSPAKQPCFLKDYQNTFDPNNVNNHLNFAFAKNDAILAYDSITAFLMAYEQLPALARANPNREAIKDQLVGISFWGVSGHITLESNGDPKNKAMYINQVQNTNDPATFISSSLSSSTLNSPKIHFPLCDGIYTDGLNA